MAAEKNILAAGARIVVRDAQWLVRKVERTRNSGFLIHCTGLSDIVRDKEMQFLSSAEKSIEVLDPAKTHLVQDHSRSFSQSLLYLESLLQKTIPQDSRMYCGYRAAMDPLPYQLEPAQASLSHPRQRILIADTVGLGKTLECGILLAELIRRGHGRRILVVTVKSILTQFQKELWSRFAIPLMRLDSEGIRRIREYIPENYNPFSYYDKSIISIDTLKNKDYEDKLQKAWWDVIVIDEAHNVAERKHGGSLRYLLAARLAERCDSLILMSATPHDGSARSFASLMNMLDPTAIANKDCYGPEDIRGLFIRRFKKDVRAQLKKVMHEREVHELRTYASEEEEAVLRALTEAHFPRSDKQKGMELFRIQLEKSFFSSPAACSESVTNSLKKLRALSKDKEESALQDIKSLEAIQSALKALPHTSFSKYALLVKELTRKESPFFFSGKKDDRLVIFTERIATLNYLADHLPSELRLKDNQFAVLKGNDSDIEQQRIVEEFSREHSELRLLLASDVASEGINLHYFCHKMIHFDIPWSLMLFQQRNGRIDRYGQTKKPAIGYLETESANETIRGDQRILEVLIRKDSSAQDNIGDPSEFLGCFDQKSEEELVEVTMATSTAEQFSKDIDERVARKQSEEDDETDILALLNSFSSEENLGEEKTIEDTKASMPSLFADTFEFVRASLDFLQMRYQLDEAEKSVEIPLNEGFPHIRELKWRFSRMPKEMRGTDGKLKLSSKISVIEEAIAIARRTEDAWPGVHYLWELHPFVQWLTDAVTTGFRRNEAPLMAVSGLEKDLAIYVIYALCPNVRGNPVFSEWFGVLVKNGAIQKETLSFEEIFGKRLGLLGGRNVLPNSEKNVDVERYEGYLPDVCELARISMKRMADARFDLMKPQLDEQRERLRRLQEKHRKQAESVKAIDKRSIEKQKQTLRKINELFDSYNRWIDETLQVQSDRPSLRVAAVLVGC